MKIRAERLILILALVLVILIVTLTIAVRESKYQRLVQCILDGRYDEAITLNYDEFVDKPYKDSESMAALAQLLNYYQRGSVLVAHFYAQDIEELSFLTDEERTRFDEFLLRLEEEYEIAHEKHMKEVNELNELLMNRYSKKVPFVGMEEEYINNTSLGEAAYSKKSFNSAAYYFQGDDGWTNFVAYCSDGVVFSVSDDRNRQTATKIPVIQTTDDEEDPYDAKSYSNEEDFYYDHYDDFFDYYDAERYYRRHHD